MEIKTLIKLFLNNYHAYLCVPLPWVLSKNTGLTHKPENKISGKKQLLLKKNKFGTK